MKQTSYLLELVARVMVLQLWALTPALTQTSKLSPIFEATVLDEKEASFYKTTEPNTTIFTFPLEELVQYIHGLAKDQDIEFTLKIGGLDVALILSANKDGIITNSNKTGRSKLIFMKGIVRDQPTSKAFIAISPSLFYANIVACSKKYSISYAVRDGKSMPNVFSLVEHRFVQPIKKAESGSICGLPININIGLQFDESMVDIFSNHNDPELIASDYAFSTLYAGSIVWWDIDFRFTFWPVWIAGPTQNDLFDADLATWASNIQDNWEDNRPCMRNDGILYFTGHSVANKGYTYEIPGFHCKDNLRGKRVAIIEWNEDEWFSQKIEFTTAHEFGHLMGLGHEDSQCAQPCNSSPNLLLCSSHGESALISNCMRDMLNEWASAPRCECLEEDIPFYPTDNCPRCDVKVTQLTTDNTNPIINCSTKSDIMNIAATINGGCNAIEQVIRAKFRQELAQVEIGSNGRFSDYFTHTRILGADPAYVELIARQDPFGPNNDMINPEIIFDFANPDVVLDLNFKLKYVPSSTIDQITHVVSVYLGSNNQPIDYKDLLIKPYFPITVQPGQTVLDVIHRNTNARFFQINSDLDFSQASQGGYVYQGSGFGITGYNFTDFHFIIGAGNKFHINPDVKLKLVDASIEGCETMWAGIELEEQASIECTSSIIKDAQVAIKLKGNAIAGIQECTFENNNFGFQAVIPGNSIPPVISLLGNTFETTSPLKLSYPGQSPLPFGGKGYTGVYIDRVPSLNINSAGTNNSLFKNLHNGIIAYNSNLKVAKSFFENIQLETGAPSLPGLLVMPGKGIYSRNGSLGVLGEGILNANPATFTNCHTGIESFQSTLSVTDNKMISVNNGVISSVGVNKKVFVSTNDIRAKDRGIAVFHALALPNGCQVNSNTVNMAGNAQGVGIKTGGSDLFWQHEGLFSLNTITVEDGAAGIDVGASHNLKVNNNAITLNNGGTQYGIGISGGDLNGVNCNLITGIGQKGIYGIMAGRSNFVCNTASGTGIGLNFDGVFVGKGSIRVSGNTMNNNGADGLLMGSDAVIGEQVHQGNKWTGAGLSVAQHLGGFLIASKSLFTVDANENADYLPDVVLPAQWFVNIPTPTTSYQCVPSNPDCPIVQSPPNYAREKEIAKGLLTGLNYQAPQLWTAQRRLYERLVEEGNPYPGDVDFTNFITASQTNGIKAYADIQIGIRQIFQTTATDRNDLATYETQIAQGLDQLAQTEALLNAQGLSQQDSITLAAQRNAIKQGLININTLRENKLASINNARNSLATSLQTQNGVLSGTGDYRINEKIVNAIFLETVAIGNNNFSNTQLSNLQDIAAQCPLAGGEAVQRARDLLALSQNPPLFYNDAITCNGLRPTRDRGDEVMLGDFVQVRPNPASENVVIQYAFGSETAEKRFQLFNVFGQLIANVLLPELEGELILPTYSFPSGAYYFVVTNSFLTGNVIISH